MRSSVRQLNTTGGTALLAFRALPDSLQFEWRDAAN